MLPALESLHSRELPHLQNKDIFFTQEKTHEMKQNHKRLKAVKKSFHISDQGPNSKLLECFKSALYVIPQVIKFLSLPKC